MNSHAQRTATELLEALRAEANNPNWWRPEFNWWRPEKVKESPALNQIVHSSPEQQASVVMSALPWSRTIGGDEFGVWGAVSRALRELILRNPPFSDNELETIFAEYRSRMIWQMYFPLDLLLARLDRDSLTPGMREELRRIYALQAPSSQRTENEQPNLVRDHIRRIAFEPGEEPVHNGQGPWTQIVFGQLAQLDEITRAGWEALFAHCKDAQQAVPGQKWRKRTQELIAALGHEQFTAKTIEWLRLGPTPNQPPEASVPKEDCDYLKGFIWTASASEDPALCRELGSFALECLRKIAGRGAVSQKIGFACVNLLAVMPGTEPVSQLMRLQSKVRYVVARKLIDKALNSAAERAGLNRGDLEDMSVPTFELNAAGIRDEKCGDYTARLSIEDDAANLSWRDANGRVLKSVPALVKRDFAPLLKHLKSCEKDLDAVLKSQRYRLESLLLNSRKIAYARWRKHFIEHPVTGTLARRLIWRFEMGIDLACGIYHNGAVLTADGKPLSLDPAKTWVTLWHPLGSEMRDVTAWRNFLNHNQITQPFKQAHREIYTLTDAERRTETYSNRFAAHIIRQHQFASLCRERGWRYLLQGAGFDGCNTPVIDLPDWNMRVEFYVDLPEGVRGDGTGEGIARTSDAGINLYLATDQVRFYRGGEPLPLDQVPAVVFSELMRDVDLFVSVCSIGNDPSWMDHGDRDFNPYWQQYAWGDLDSSAETRREVLEQLLPKLAIGPLCRIEGKYLIVAGELNTYRIHLGSGNILMEPGSCYLCIVPASRTPKELANIYLPFEGDQRLAVILSKALLLAKDTKITDPTIVRQIRRR